MINYYVLNQMERYDFISKGKFYDLYAEPFTFVRSKSGFTISRFSYTPC